MIKKSREIENKGNSYVKSKLILTFSIKNKFPKLKARLTLANKKEIQCEVVGNTPFEKPLKKAFHKTQSKSSYPKWTATLIRLRKSISTMTEHYSFRSAKLMSFEGIYSKNWKAKSPVHTSTNRKRLNLT